MSETLPISASPKPASRQVAVVVMGMHRSGTSALARVLNLLGCQTPRTLMTATEFNPQGHWESESIRQFNDELLQAVGSGWSDWAPVNPGFARSPAYAAYLGRGADLLREEFGAASPVVLKDPRICRLGEFWMDALDSAGFEPLVVLPLRNPLEVAASLARRDGLDESYGQLLWLRHVLDAESSTRGRRRIFTTFEDLLEGWEALVARVGAGLGIAWPRFSDQVAIEITGSLAAELKHHAKASRGVIANPGLSVWLRDTYAALDNWAQNGENAQDYARLDEIRGQVDEAAPAFGKLILSGERSRLQVAALETQIAELRKTEQQLGILQQELEKLRGAPDVHALLAEHQERSRALAAELEALRNRLADQESALRQKQEEAAQAWAEVAATREQLAASGAENERLTHHAAALSRKLAESENWVFQLADERQQADRQADRLDREVQRLTREMYSLKGQATRLKESLARETLARKAAEAEKRKEPAAVDPAQVAALAQTERESQAKYLSLQTKFHAAREALAEVGKQQDARAQELAVLSRKLLENEKALAVERAFAAKQGQTIARAEAAEAEMEARHLSLEAEAWSLREALRLAEEHQQAVNRTEGIRAEQDLKHLSLQTEVRSLRDAVAKAERMQEQRCAELVVLTRKLQTCEQAQESLHNRTEWLRSAFLVVTRLPWWWHFLPPRMRRERELARLRQRGLFDAEAYLAAYPDVVGTGLDPLRHYVRHGMNEGRQPGLE